MRYQILLQEVIKPCKGKDQEISQAPRSQPHGIVQPRPVGGAAAGEDPNPWMRAAGAALRVAQFSLSLGKEKSDSQSPPNSPNPQAP